MSNTEKFSQEKQEFLVQAATNKLINFAELIDKDYKAEWFHELIATKLQEAVEKVRRGEKARIILAIPPRHGKSQLSSVYFPAWAMGKYPGLKVILSTYGAELSEKMGLQTRDVISSEIYQRIYPGIQLRKDQKAKAKWMTNKGGSYTGVGIGTAVTGTGAEIIILDDPHKDRAEAESQTVRDSVWEYYRSTLYSRLEGFGAVVVIMQRWHQDDLVGRLLEEQERLEESSSKDFDTWEIINFPAIAEKDEYLNGALVRKEGDALWPSKFGVPVLANIKQTAGVYNWVSQYQQDPILAEAQEFKVGMFKYFDEEELAGKYLKYYTVVDPAISQKKEADNSVVLTVAKEVNGPNWYRIREDSGKYTPTQLIDLIFTHQEAYKSKVGIEVVAYQMALKFFVVERQKKDQVYFPVIELRSSTKKEERVRGLLPLYDAGIIFHRRGDIEYERELMAFPRGRRDDRIDAMSMCLMMMENTRGTRARQYRQKFKSYVARKRQ